VKKLIALVALLVLGVFGCGEKTMEAATTSAPAAGSASAVPSLAPEAAAKKGFELYDQEKPDEAGAVKLWEPACEAGDDLACVGMGIAYTFGVGGKTKDQAKGVKLIQPACEKGVQRACSVLGQATYFGWSVTKDIEKAKALWTKACDGRVGQSCYFLGLMMAAPDGPPEWRNVEEGEKLQRKGCDLGYRRACDAVKKLDQKNEIAKLRQKVSVKWWGTEKDGTCMGKGLPPYRKDYEGGTFDENEKVAKHDGCVSPFQSKDDALRNTFCCPYEQKD
jgi:hypothetical protein